MKGYICTRSLRSSGIPSSARCGPRGDSALTVESRRTMRSVRKWRKSLRISHHAAFDHGNALRSPIAIGQIKRCEILVVAVDHRAAPACAQSRMAARDQMRSTVPRRGPDGQQPDVSRSHCALSAGSRRRFGREAVAERSMSSQLPLRPVATEPRLDISSLNISGGSTKPGSQQYEDAGFAVERRAMRSGFWRSPT